MRYISPKTWLLIGFSLISIASSHADEVDKKLKVGDEAPDFELLNQEGKKVSLKSFRGKKAIVLAFNRAHW